MTLVKEKPRTYHGMSEIFGCVVGYVEEFAVLCHHHQETVHRLHTHINRKEIWNKLFFFFYITDMKHFTHTQDEGNKMKTKKKR